MKYQGAVFRHYKTQNLSDLVATYLSQVIEFNSGVY